tara:strand:- start:993 stop:1469 length:477 start_codon:yes stop_codon:yes gene_type:complete
MKRLFTDISNGLKRDIHIRKNSFRISVREFDLISNKYFKILNQSENFRFEVERVDLEKMILLLRLYYNYWIKINDFEIEIYKDFPKKFIITKEVNFQNHPHIPRIFDSNEIMLKANDNYSTCNWQRGIPLMAELDKKNGIIDYSCQINYSNINTTDFN